MPQGIKIHRLAEEEVYDASHYYEAKSPGFDFIFITMPHSHFHSR
jgi:hypothetical protein